MPRLCARGIRASSPRRSSASATPDPSPTWRPTPSTIQRSPLPRSGPTSGSAADGQAIVRRRTRDEWLSIFAEADVCLTPVHEPDPALVTSKAAERPAPALGADTDDLLEEAGIGGAERARLRDGGVI